MPICSTCGTRYGSTVRICITRRHAARGGADRGPASRKAPRRQVPDRAFISGGGMGSVYRATHVMLGKTVAVKVIRDELVTSDDVVAPVPARGARGLHSQSSEHRHRLRPRPDDDGTLYIAMEFIDGPSLKEAIRRDGPLAPGRAVDILRQVASALSVAHQQSDRPPRFEVPQPDAHRRSARPDDGEAGGLRHREDVRRARRS